MNRNMLDYLPDYLQEYNELKAIMESEQTEFQFAWGKLNAVFNDQFVDSATLTGIRRWETVLGINPKATDTIEERKFRISIKLNQQLPYTFRFLKEQLTNLCGEEGKGFRLILNPDEYSLAIKLALSNKNNYEDISDMLKRFVPANLVVDIDLMYNQYHDIVAYTHGQLAAYTHSQIRNEVL